MRIDGEQRGLGWDPAASGQRASPPAVLSAAGDTLHQCCGSVVHRALAVGRRVGPRLSRLFRQVTWAQADQRRGCGRSIDGSFFLSC